MYTHHEYIDTPSDETIIWRYISLEKALALLSTQELFLTTMDKFRDRWEGTWPKRFLDDLDGLLSPDEITNSGDHIKIDSFISCWNASPHESAALWDQYAQTSGLAIRTTVGNLKRSILDDDVSFFLGRVKYLDYEIDNIPRLNFMILPFIKRKSFQHENEVRLLVSYSDNLNFKNTLRVNLGILIQEIYLSPSLEDWLLEPIKDLLEKYGLSNITPKKSDLYTEFIK